MVERKFNHFIVNGELLLADPKSAKSKYGHNCPEYLPPTDPHFLRRGVATYKDSKTVYQLTEPTPEILVKDGYPIGKGFVTVEIENYSGTYHEGQVHESRIVWEDEKGKK